MASRRSLVSRQNREASSPQVQHARQHTALPPYEPPTCPLTESAKRSIADISSNHDYRKYERHIQAAIVNITNCSGDINDRLYARKERVRKMAEKREVADPDAEKSKAEEEAEAKARDLEGKVEKLTTESEKALRDLIDYKEEQAEQGKLVEKVIEDVAVSSAQGRRAPANGARRRASLASEDEDEERENSEVEDVKMDDAEPPASILSPTELLKKAKEEYDTLYKSRSMRKRYADHNDYIGFKRIIHDARHPGENKPPMPHASTWFADSSAQAPNASAARRRRMASTTDNTENGDDDDEIQMTGVVSSLKCPLTLKTFKEPYSNHVCKHSFEKAAILEYHLSNAVSFADPSQASRRGRGGPQGPKQVKCPERGCEAMLELKDFYDDQMILRQVKRQAAQAAAEMEDEMEEPADDAPPSGQGGKSYKSDDTPGKYIKNDRSQTYKREIETPSLRQERSSTPESQGSDPEIIEMED